MTAPVSIQDSIVAFLRGRPEGVMPAEIAGRFLRLRNPDRKTAAAAIAGMLGADRRCFPDADGRWLARAAGPQERSDLLGLPWMPVYVLTDPGARRILYLSVWEITPAVSSRCSGWLCDPASLPPDDRDILVSAADDGFTRESADALLAAAAVENRIPVFLSSAGHGLLRAACAARGRALTDDIVIAGELLKAAGRPVPRPMTLAAFERSVFGAEQPGCVARKQGGRFAAALFELFTLLARNGIESRDQLDRCAVRDKEPLFAGKTFTYETLLALPARPGVYGFKDRAGAHLYIGKANNLKRRLLSYFSDTGESPQKIARLREQSHSLVTGVCGSELECLIDEYRLIKKYSPPLNRKADILERRGDFRPINDCIVLLPHAVPAHGMSLWFRRDQKILLRPFTSAFDDEKSLLAELKTFFFTPHLQAGGADFPEQEIATRWLKSRGDALPAVPVSRLACAEEVLDAMKTAWRDMHPVPPA